MKFAVFGCGTIAGRFACAALQHPDIELAAVAARNMDKINAFADTYGIEKRSTDFEEILSDPEIDAIYIALPHLYHAQWAIEALRHHKAVLCEKPAVIHPDEMQAIIQASDENRTLFMEAMKTRFIPAYQKVKELVEQGAIGSIETITVSLCNDFHIDPNDRTHYYNQPKQGGGMLDGGCYALNYFLDLAGNDLHIDHIHSKMDGDIDLDIQMRGTIHDIPVSLESSMLVQKPKLATITGTKGTIQVPDLHRPTSIDVTTEKGTVHMEVPYKISDMYSQIASFYDTWKAGQMDNPLMPRRESLAQAVLIEQIRQAAMNPEAIQS